MMKKLLLLCIWLCCTLTSLPGFAQTAAGIYTPKGSWVTAWIINEMTAYDRGYWDNYFSSPNRTQLSYFGDGYSSSNRFNCHGYAWNMAEGGPVRWIGAYVTTEEDIYMTDGSYVRVCNETYPAKVSWADGDHSAITTNVAGRWISKWNKYPLMNHHKDDTPFGSDYRYYVSTKITASATLICEGSTATFSVQDIPGATYSWTSSSNLSLSGSGHSITGTPVWGANGSGWVEVYISTGCGTATRRINLDVGVPAPINVIWGNNLNPLELCPNTEYLAFADPAVYDKYEWFLPYGWETFNTSGGPNPWICWDYQLNFKTNTTGGTVAVRRYNACGASDLTFIVTDLGCSGMLMTVSPNPASSQVRIDARAQKKTIKEVQLMDKLGAVKRVKKYPANTDIVNFDVSGLSPNVYYLKIYDGRTWTVKSVRVQ